MHIGFEAKRAFFNNSGLGNYSRNTINGLAKFYPDINLSLFTPDTNPEVFTPNKGIEVIVPGGIWKLAKSLWRRNGMSSSVRDLKPDIFHGLSHELPVGIEHTGVKCVVTMHDLIFLRYPEFYKAPDIKIYEKKFMHAARVARRIIAISEQTKSDLITYFGAEKEKIEVLYQGCNPVYFEQLNEERKTETARKYTLPQDFILYVGTIEERKNLLGILKALVSKNISLPLVVVGRKTRYFNECMSFIEQNNLTHQIQFHHTINYTDLPAFYQLAKLMIYPSFFEGFGLPVLEAQASGCPVITSNISSMPEAGGSAARLVSPDNTDEIASAIDEIVENDDLRNKMIRDGLEHASSFSEDKVIARLMDFYKRL
jgi:glycosyltransferase involved in cell wall biosynthesis